MICLNGGSKVVRTSIAQVLTIISQTQRAKLTEARLQEQEVLAS